MHKSSLPSRRHSWMLLLLLCAGPILASAQDDLSLGQLVEMALQENYDIRIYRNIALAAETGNTKGNAGMLPTVDLLAEQLAPSVLEERSLPPAVLLISDGMPTDDYKPALGRFLDEAERLALYGDLKRALKAP